MDCNTEVRLGVHILTRLQPLVPTMVTDAFAVHFENGYGASLIVGPVSFDRWELAVVHDGQLCYSTPITSDVLRVNQFDDLESILDQLAQLPKNDNCSHEHDWGQEI